MSQRDRSELERRLRIRHRNLERLTQEEMYISEQEAPPAVLERVQSQIRVEQEELRLFERQIAELEGRGRRQSSGRGGALRLALGPVSLVRVFLAVGVVAVVLAIFVWVLPRPPANSTAVDVPSTTTPAPTFTALAEALLVEAPTETATPSVTDTPVPSPTPEPTVPTSTPTPRTPVGAVNVEVLNLRGGPDTSYGIRAKLMTGEKLNLLGRNELGTWLAVSTLDGATGWVAAEYVDIDVMILDLPVKEVEEQQQGG